MAEGYTRGDPNVLDRSSAYWAHRYVFNMMHIKYSYMRAVVNQTALATEAKSAKLVAKLDNLTMTSVRNGATEATIAALRRDLTAEYTDNVRFPAAIGVQAQGGNSVPHAFGWCRRSTLLLLSRFISGQPAKPGAFIPARGFVRMHLGQQSYCYVVDTARHSHNEIC